MRHLFKATLAAGLVLALPAQAETRVTFKAAKTGSSYYQMSVQVAEAMKAGTDGAKQTEQQQQNHNN